MKKEVSATSSSPKPRPSRRIVPRWDSQLRQLWVGSILIKSFTGPAPNQELILQAFQEMNWCCELFDPLPRKADLDPPSRLQDAAERLNGNQRRPLLRFHLRRSSTALIWAWTVPLAELQALLAAASDAGMVWSSHAV